MAEYSMFCSETGEMLPIFFSEIFLHPFEGEELGEEFRKS